MCANSTSRSTSPSMPDSGSTTPYFNRVYLLHIWLYIRRSVHDDSCHPSSYCAKKPQKSASSAHIEAKVRDIAVLDHIILALQALHALLRGSGEGAAGGHEIVEASDFGADEATFDIGMDLAGSLGSLRALRHGPGAHLILAGGQERNQVKQAIADLNHAVRAQFGQAQRLQVLRRVRLGQLNQLGLQARRDRHDLRALRPRPLRDPGHALQFA